MAKRGINIYKRADGRWEGRFGKGRRADGKLIYGYVYARRYGDCKEKLDQAKALYRYIPKAVKTCGTGKVSDFIEHWLLFITKPRVKASTFSNYVTMIEKWIIPSLGECILHKVGREEVQCFISGLSEFNLSPGTIRNIHHVLQAIFKKAVEYGYLPANPSEGACLPKMEKKEICLLSLSEQKRLEQAAKEEKNGFAILLASYTGLRVGEICGLTWEDIDWEQGMLRVSRTIQRIQCREAGAETKTVLLVGSTKSDHSMRMFPLPPRILTLLKEHKKTSSGKYIFEYHGHSLEPRILQYRFQALLKKAGLPRIHFHALRHTFATRCIELNFDIKTLSEILGHASAKMTLDRYGHSQMSHMRLAMNSLDGLLVRGA